MTSYQLVKQCLKSLRTNTPCSGPMPRSPSFVRCHSSSSSKSGDVWLCWCCLNSACCKRYQRGSWSFGFRCSQLEKNMLHFQQSFWWLLLCPRSPCLPIVHSSYWSFDLGSFSCMQIDSLKQESWCSSYRCVWSTKTNNFQGNSLCDQRLYSGSGWVNSTLWRSNCWDWGCSPCGKALIILFRWHWRNSPGGCQKCL